MSVAKQEQYDLETRIYTFRTDNGVQAIRDYLLGLQTSLIKTWPQLSGETLIKAQGIASNVNQLLRIIDDGPKHKEVKPLEGAPQ